MEDSQEFYTIQEFADKLRIHHNTVRNGIKKGKYQAFRVGSGPRSEFRIPKNEVNRICEFDMIKNIEEIANRIVEEKMGMKNELQR